MSLRGESCELSALLEVVRLVGEEGVDISAVKDLVQHPQGNDQQSEHKTRSHYHKHTSSGSSGGSGAAGYGANSAYSAAPVAVPHQEPERQQPHQTSSASRLIPGGPCFSCGITEAPQWRRPDPGTMLLCNRCGIHYMRYRKLPGPKREPQAPRYSAPSSPLQVGKRKATDGWSIPADGQPMVPSFTVGSCPTTNIGELLMATHAGAAGAGQQGPADMLVLPKAGQRRVASGAGVAGAEDMDMGEQVQQPSLTGIDLSALAQPTGQLAITAQQMFASIFGPQGTLAGAQPMDSQPSLSAAFPTMPLQAAQTATVLHAQQPQAHAVAFVSLLNTPQGLAAVPAAPAGLSVADLSTMVLPKRAAKGPAAARKSSSSGAVTGQEGQELPSAGQVPEQMLQASLLLGNPMACGKA